MCGIVGAIDLEGTRLFPLSKLRAMCGAIAHRGPDDEHLHMEPGLAMGARRLAIVDLAGGRQPLANESGRVWVACNGELFDYPEVFRQLAQRGHCLATRCDTEAWVHLYEDDGERIFMRARGQYAVSLWDADQRLLLLGRDRVGICPLYYAHGDGWLLWGSEIKALLASGLIAPEPDPRGIDHVFTFYATGTSRTCFRDIRSLPPGHFLRIRDGQVQLVQYWDLDFPDRHEERRVANPATLVDELEGLLGQAIRRRLRGDVPVVAYLSGGVDSSLVLALAVRESGHPLPAFNIGLSGAGADEREKAEETALALNCPLTTLDLKPCDLATAYPGLIRAAEFPDPVTSDACMIRLAGLVHDHGYKATMTGEGADEALAGYHLFKLQKFHAAFDWRLGWIGYWAGGGGLRIHGGTNGRNRTPFRATAGVRTARQVTFELSGRSRETFYSDRMWQSLEGHSPFDDLDLTNDRITRWHPVNQAAYVEYHTFLPGLILTAAGDRSAMHSSLEARPPFLDEDLIEFCAAIHPDYKLRGWTGKWLLRRLAQRVLPPRIARRRKQGFAANLSGTFLGRERPAWVDQLLSPESLRTTGYFAPEAVAHVLARRMRSGVHLLGGIAGDAGLTTVIATQLWHHTFLGGGLADLPSWSPPATPEILDAAPWPTVTPSITPSTR